jgi:hypothetical protein
MYKMSFVSFLFYYLAMHIPAAMLIVATPKKSPIRVLWVPCLILICYKYFIAADNLPLHSVYRTILGTPAMAMAIHMLNLLLINGIDKYDVIREAKLEPSAGIVSTLAAACKVVFSMRGIGTRWQAKNTPSLPAFYTLNGQSPTRGRFLLRETAIFLWQYLLLDILFDIRRRDPDDVVRQHAPGTEFMYLSATREQWQTRIFEAVFGPQLAGRVLIDILSHRFIAIVAVALCRHSPADWPPAFGSMFDGYTVRYYKG